MSKTLTYSGFAVSAMLIIFAFVTAKTYTQLIIAVILYPLLAYFALRVLPRRGGNTPASTIQLPARPVQKAETVVNQEKVIADIDKRTFLKLIGAAGLSFFVFSILGRRVESFFFGERFSQNSGFAPALPDSQQSQASPTEGYKITEIDDGLISYYGFTNIKGNWLIMQEDTQTSSFRYARGDVNFSNGWKNRENLKYDYYFNLF